MTDELRSNIINTLVALIVIGTAYGLVADEPQRKVVLTPAEYAEAIQQARIEAAREAFTAAQVDNECFLNWRANPGAKAKGQM